MTKALFNLLTLLISIFSILSLGCLTSFLFCVLVYILTRGKK